MEFMRGLPAMRQIVLTAIASVLIGTAVFLIQKKQPSADPFASGLEAYAAGNYAKAYAFFEKSGRPEALFSLGAMNFAGKGVPQNSAKALAFYKRAADLNYAPALTTLGILLAGENNIDEALAFLEKAADLNDGEALILLAKWYENGTHVEQNTVKAVEYYEKAAKAGVLDAETALYIIYSKGKKGVYPNPNRALRHRLKVEKQNELLKKLRPSEKK